MNITTPIQPLELRPRDVALMLGISERQVQRLAALGELVRVGEGRNMRITADSVRAYHDRRRHAAEK